MQIHFNEPGFFELEHFTWAPQHVFPYQEVKTLRVFAAHDLLNLDLDVVTVLEFAVHRKRTNDAPLLFELFVGAPPTGLDHFQQSPQFIGGVLQRGAGHQDHIPVNEFHQRNGAGGVRVLGVVGFVHDHHVKTHQLQRF